LRGYLLALHRRPSIGGLDLTGVNAADTSPLTEHRVRSTLIEEAISRSKHAEMIFPSRTTKRAMTPRAVAKAMFRSLDTLGLEADVGEII
jgi:hypothetical protein